MRRYLLQHFLQHFLRQQQYLMILQELLRHM